MVDVSIEQVAALASQNTLPEPSLHLDSLPSSTTNVAALQLARQNPTRETPNRAVSYNPENPWNGVVPGATGLPHVPFSGSPSIGPSVVAGSGLPDGWWKSQSKVQVNLLGLQGFILNRYTVYEVVSDVSVKMSCGVSSLLTCGSLCSVALLCVGDTLSLHSSGSASSRSIPSDCCLLSPRNGSDVSLVFPGVKILGLTVLQPMNISSSNGGAQSFEIRGGASLITIAIGVGWLGSSIMLSITQ